MKVTFLQIEEAYARAMWGESVRAIARSLGVTEGCLRFHFRKGVSPTEVRRVAYAMHHAQQARAMLTEAMRTGVDKLLLVHSVRNDAPQYVNDKNNRHNFTKQHSKA